PETITLQDLAQRMNERVGDVVKFMIQQGEMLRGNDIIDADTAELIAEEFGHTVKRVSEADVEIGLEGGEDDAKDLKPRAPIVTIMGHVDHGKTSLLDALRKTDVVAGEAGGITQHIGAYQVKLKSGDKITFLDTPGHAAFTAMRARGATATDIAILVVAADDSVMPQTIESINHAKAAGVPIIVAVNKSDLPDANADKVLTDLLQHDVQVESMGGSTQAVKVSALTGAGLDELTDAITLQAELLELKANPARPADGTVIESQLDKGRGPVATVLVKRGTLKRGDIVVAGAQWGKVRALVDERGQQLKDAGPSLPVEVLGLDGAPDPGDQFVVVDTEARAREVTEYRVRQKRQVSGKAGAAARASLDQLLSKLKDGSVETSELPVVVKGDVQGSVEAISQSLDKISTDEVRARVIHGAVGGISESDVLLAQSSEAPIFAFNVRANKQARDLAEKEGVEIRYYSVIYDLIDDVKSTLSGMLAPEKRETFIGYAEILEVFNITKVGKVAGCRVSEGKVLRGCGVRLLRDDVVIHEGKLKTLKRFKDEVTEVSSGMECGMAFERYDDMRVGDKIECFQVEEIARSLE
ncbi:MAG TPA: translation initiation factor IF-2, partial [Hyphomonas sp.]|nr:translation initiation factor IF-2 [Hyphomonas sp.]HCN94932.1 translation initiation factor IF-2 [Hyphomonas sp.]